MRESYKYLHTKDGVTVVVGGKPYAISSTARNFPEVLQAVKSGADPVTLLDAIERDARRVQRVVEGKLTENLVYNDGVILYKGKALFNHAVRRLLQMIDQGQDIVPLVNFVEKQQRNPDATVHEHLYEFLEFGRIPLTADGDFLAYKAVRADYKDIHSGSFMNEVGCVCSVPRESVDPDRNRTCSYGLHVCSYAYLPHFSHAQGHVMICKVSPEDVVAIPSDYNNTKMRTARYEVVGEVTTYYQEGRDELGSGALVRSEEFEVWYEEKGKSQLLADIYDAYYTLEEAKQQAHALAKKENIRCVWVEQGESKVYEVPA